MAPERALSDRGIQALIVLVALAAGGFVAVGLAWSGVAARLDVGLQLPFVVSGAFGGVAVTAAFLAIAGTQLERRHAATERFLIDATIRDVAYIADRLPPVIARRARSIPAGTTDGGPRLALVHNGRTIHTADCRMAAGRDLPPLDPATAAGDLRACRICRPL